MKLLILFLLMVQVAQAASSGNLLLSGVVAPNNSLVITPNGTNNTTLNVTAGVSNLNVASVAETSNDGNGYKITAQSVNSGFLQLSATAKAAYTFSYNGAAAISLTNAAQTVKTSAALTQLTTATSQVVVNVTALPNALAGTYSDTVTISIVGL